MKERKEIERKAKIIEFIHYFIFVFHLAGIVFLIIDTPLRIWAAIYIGCIGIAQASAKGACPLTVEENSLREKARKKKKDGFIHDLFLKHFNLNVPHWLIDGISWISFILSYVIILNYFLHWF